MPMKIVRILILPFLTLLFALAGGCSSDECLQNKNALPLAGFYSSSERNPAISIDSLQVSGIGVPGDSILSPGSSAISSLYLPFRLDQDETSYEFRYIKKELAALDLKDVITFCYTREPRFVSAACGVSYVFKIQEIRHTSVFIDSVTCPAGEITNMAVENLKIYFRTE